MYNPINIPFGGVMLFNVVKLKEGVTIEDVEMELGEMCNVVKESYGDDHGGFIAGQVFKFSGFISDEGSVSDRKQAQDDHIAILTYWKSFEQHEKSHADKVFRKKFGALLDKCEETYEVGYEMLWQGVPEHGIEEAA
jgi:hypothetical protein